MANEIWQNTATQIAADIRNKKVTSRQVVEAHLQRIAEVNPKINAIVRVLADEALAGADLADAAVRAGAKLGPLHGVPMTVKENIDIAGYPTTQGVAALAEAIPPADSPTVERIKPQARLLLVAPTCPT